MSVALSILGCYGICATIGLIFSPMHGIVPFLILGTYISQKSEYIILSSQLFNIHKLFTDKNDLFSIL